MKIYPKEIKEWKYWVHLAIISVVVLGILEIFSAVSYGGGYIAWNMFNIKNILFSIPLLFVGDVLAHTLLKLN